MTPEDAVTAADEGIPATVVSNHGGRQLDHAMASLDALPPIADAVGDRMELYLDSGWRGTDVLKALALGARGVFRDDRCTGRSRRVASPRSPGCWSSSTASSRRRWPSAARHGGGHRPDDPRAAAGLRRPVADVVVCGGGMAGCAPR